MGRMGVRGLLGVACACGLALASSASATVARPGTNCPVPQPTTFTSSGPVGIPDQPPPVDPADPPIDNSVESTISVTGLSGTVLDVEVTTDIGHTANGDLLISLIGPSGKEMMLSANNGFDRDDVFRGTVWDDGADPGGSASAATANEGLAGDHTYVDGVAVPRLVPDEALGVFLGDNPNGDWKLRVWDVGPVDTGTINSWSISIATTDPVALGRQGASSTSPTYTVPDGGTVTASMTHVAGRGPLRSVELFINSLTYTGVDDLELTLRSPGGRIATLTRRNALPDIASAQGVAFRIPSGPIGGASYPVAGFGTPVPVAFADPAVFPPQLAPEEPFSAFAGEDAGGVWTLTATDLGLTPGGGSFGLVALTTGFWRPCASNLDLAVAGPPIVALGNRVTYSATVRALGPGIANDARIQLFVGGLIDTTVSVSGRGQCVPNGVTQWACTWPGESPPGSVHTVSVVGMQSVTGTYAAGAFATASQQVSPAANPVSRRVGWMAVPTSPKYRATNGSRCTVLGTDKNDNLSAAAGVVCGRGGNDTITTANNRDTVDGGAGNDVIRTLGGNDKVYGGKGNDTIIAGSGNDLVDGGPGKDSIDAGAGSDRIVGGLGKDKVNGGSGRDSAKRDPLDVFRRVETFFTK